MGSEKSGLKAEGVNKEESLEVALFASSGHMSDEFPLAEEKGGRATIGILELNQWSISEAYLARLAQMRSRAEDGVESVSVAEIKEDEIIAGVENQLRHVTLYFRPVRS